VNGRRAIDRVMATLGARYEIDRFLRVNGPDPFRILVGCIISLRTKDEVTYAATDRLFARAATPRTMGRLRAKTIAELIFPAGFSNRKAEQIRTICRLLVSEYLGSIREEIRFTTEGKVRHLTVGRRIQGAIAPVEGADSGQELKITNTKYWMGPDVTIAQALKGKVRDFGRVWNLDGKSAEICQIDWTGP